MRRGSEGRSRLSNPTEHKGVRGRRERHDIIMEVLKIAKNGVRKTNIMKKVGLSYAQLRKYLKSLKDADFICEESGVWKTTEKGLQVIEACKICHRLVKGVR